MIKLKATFWNSKTRQSETQEFEACESALDDVATRMRNRNSSREQKIDALCDELTRPMGGRKISKVEVVK